MGVVAWKINPRIGARISVDCPMGYDKYGHSPLTKRDDPPSILSLWIQPYLLRKYDWGMMTRGCLVPSQTVAMDP